MNSDQAIKIFENLGQIASNQFDVENMIVEVAQTQLGQIRSIIEKLDSIYMAICGGGIDVSAIAAFANIDDTDSIADLMKIASKAANGLVPNITQTTAGPSLNPQNVGNLSSIINSAQTSSLSQEIINNLAEIANVNLNTLSNAAGSSIADMFGLPSDFSNLASYDSRAPEIYLRYAIQYKERIRHKRHVGENVLKQLYSIKDTFLNSYAYKAMKILPRAIKDPIAVSSPTLIIDKAKEGVKQLIGEVSTNVKAKVKYDMKEMHRNVKSIEKQLVVIVRKPTLASVLTLANYFKDLYQQARSQVSKMGVNV